MRFNWKPWAWLGGFVILLLVGWGVYKVTIGKRAVEDAQLAKDYKDQKDSTKAWKEAYTVVEKARQNLHDTLNVLSGLVRVSHEEAAKWHDEAARAKGRLILIQRPIEADSTNPRWMHRALQLETIVTAQDREIANKDNELALSNTKQKLLLSQLSKDSVALHSANENILRLDKIVDQYKAKSECKIAWLLPCLSRTQAFIAGGIVGAASAVLVNTALKK